MAASGSQQWFNFKFFESKSIKTTELERAEITAACFSRNYLIICDADGFIRVFDRSLKALYTEFKGYSGCITHVKSVATHNAIVTLGDDSSDGRVGIAKVWVLDALEESKDQRPINAEFSLFNHSNPAPAERVPLRTNFNDEVRRNLRFVGRESVGTNGARRAALSFTTCIVSFDVSEDLTTIAAGLTNGDIIILRTANASTDLTRAGSRVQYSRLSTPTREAPPGTTVGGLCFIGFSNTRNGGGALKEQMVNIDGVNYSHMLFAVYEGFSVQWRRDGRGDYSCYAFPMIVGASSADCCAVSEDGELAVADRTTKGRIYFFNNENVTRMCEVEPGTVKIGFHRQYLVTLSQNDANRKEKFQFGAYDVTAMIRALNEPTTNPAWVLSDVGQLLLINQKDERSSEVVVNQRVVRYTEMDFPVKLKQLFERECYDIAIRMAKKVDEVSGTNNEQLNIQKRYGEHLFKRGKYEESINQYIKTIGGSVEPSYVIRQFLDAQRIKYLTKYLEELHSEKHKIANKNHTTLLLNCFTKMNERDKLRDFINRSDIRFDAHNAIKVCRQAGYYVEATQLAEKYQLHNEYVKIQLDNLRDPSKALRFIQSLPVDVAEGIFLDHGKQLVALEPEATTDLLTKLCTKWVSGTRRLAADNGGRGGRGGNPSGPSGGLGGKEGGPQTKPSDRSYAYEYVHVFVDAPYFMLRFLEGVANFEARSGALKYKILDDDFKNPNSELAIKQRVVYHTLIELYLTRDLKRSIKPADGRNGHEDSAESGAGEKERRQYVDPNAKSSSLSEAAGGAPRIVSSTTYMGQLDLAYSIITMYDTRYDHYHVLALVQQHEFERGILYMLQMLKLNEEIVAHYAKAFERKDLSVAARLEAKDKLIDTCKHAEESAQHRRDGHRYRGEGEGAHTSDGPDEQHEDHQGGLIGSGGDDESNRSMWVSLLSILVRSDLDVSDDIKTVLNHVQERDLLPPVAVIEILSSNPNLKLKTVRHYVLTMLSADEKVIRFNQEILKSNTERSTRLHNELRQLTTTATVFQTSKCSRCSSALDLPAAHFLCKHSFHKRCLNDALECNLCSAETRKTIQQQKDNEIQIDKHDQFFSSVAAASAEDGFGVVAGHFAHGIFSAPALRKEALLVGTMTGAFDADSAVVHEVEDDWLGANDLEDPASVEMW